VIAFIEYALIPSLFNRRLSKKVIKKMKGNAVALTFDDGPDKRYTYQVLKKLKDHNIKATFFVLGEKAEANPKLIYRMIKEGHEVELHGLTHQCHWLLSPIKLTEDMEKSIAILESLDVKPKFLRPTWGLFSIYTRKVAREHGMECVFWSIHGFDWSKHASAASIIKRLQRVKAGDIILVHDGNGAEGAPQNTIDALDKVINNVKEKGLTFKTISEGV
jgi:peptidoglycan/xylan/chitin deacetylase (PgdA/CDA1 family)